ncbi:MAG: YdjY domain-containing protein [Phycisphaerae bacterium]|nr:YdjY domain-containing protein [Phycisphaerae bacterium]
MSIVRQSLGRAALLLPLACAFLRLSSNALAADPPATAPAQVRPFQPGIAIDWRAPAVLVDCRIVLREGPLEFFACFPGKEHESILRMEARAEHIALALGLIGVEAAPARAANEPDDATLSPASAPASQPVIASSLVDIEVVLADPPSAPTAATPSTTDIASRPTSAPVEAWTWLRELATARPPIPRAWLFTGSRSDGRGGLAADRSGAGLALVDISESLIGLTRSHTSSDAGLWAACNTSAIPADDAKVTLILRPAKPRTRRYTVDWRGSPRVDDRLVSLADFADLIRIDRTLRPEAAVTILVDPQTLIADERTLIASLERMGVPSAEYQLIRPR